MGGERFPGLFINQLLCISVVRAEEHLPVYFFDRVNGFSHALIYGLNRFDGRGFHTGMSYHIRICKVDDDYIVFSGPDGFCQLIAYFVSAHLRLQVVSGDLGGIDQDTVFSFVRLLYPAVKEEGHMCVFFSLRDPCLLQAVRRQVFSKCIGYLFFYEGAAGGKLDVPVEKIKAAAYTVTLVNEGRNAYGEGSYKAGETVTIYAGIKAGYSFDKWTSRDIAIARPYTSKLTFTMPAHNVVVKATWDRAGSILPSLPGISDDTTPNWLNLDDHDAYVQGYPDGRVKPQNNITRAEVATIFYRLLTDDAREYFWSNDSGFSDVKAGDWFNTAVSTMVNAGILTGYNDGTFRPSDPITRAEFATIAARFLSDPYSLQDQFYDTEGHWAEVYINRAAEVGWINGYNDGSFRPNKAITRAEAVTLVNNVLGREPHADYMLDDMITWPDNPKSAWYYEDIQEATNSHDYRWSSGKRYEIWTSLN